MDPAAEPIGVGNRRERFLFVNGGNEGDGIRPVDEAGACRRGAGEPIRTGMAGIRPEVGQRVTLGIDQSEADDVGISRQRRPMRFARFDGGLEERQAAFFRDLLGKRAPVFN